jgi:hypothetical protein
MATVAVMYKCLSGYKSKDRDNEAGSNRDSEASSFRGIEKRYVEMQYKISSFWIHKH